MMIIPASGRMGWRAVALLLIGAILINDVVLVQAQGELCSRFWNHPPC